jgi:hypothetical protein
MVLIMTGWEGISEKFTSWYSIHEPLTYWIFVL